MSTAPATSNRRRRRARLQLLTAGVALLALVLADALVGALLIEGDSFRGRPLPPYGSLLSERQRELVRERRAVIDAGEAVETSPFDPELGWVHRPTPPDSGRLDGFNSIAARGRREYDPLPAPGVLRLAGFGDSFMQCAEVGWRESWEHQLEALEPGWEVLNFGVNGYGTDQALLRFRRVGPTLGAHVVCIGLMLENIARNVNRYKPLLHAADTLPLCKPRFVLESGALRLVPVPFEDERELLDAIEDGSVAQRMARHEHWSDPPLPALLWHSSLVRLAAAWAERGKREPRRLWLDDAGEPRALTLAILERFHVEALAGGARAALVMVWPPQKDLRAALAGDHYWSGLEAELGERGVPVLDLTGALAEAAGAERDTASLYAGAHLSPRGNAVVAAAVRAWVVGQGLAPEGAR